MVFFNADGTYPKTVEDPLPKDVAYTHTIVGTNYSVTSENATTYACTSNVMQVPKEGKRFLVAANPVIESVSGSSKVHHLTVYGCNDTAYGRSFFKTGYCMGDGPGGNGECSVLLHGCKFMQCTKCALGI